MAETCERWVAAHAVVILAPTCCYPLLSPLKLMIDRLVGLLCQPDQHIKLPREK